jgi:outer membrane lipoprotein SlyB
MGTAEPDMNMRQGKLDAALTIALLLLGVGCAASLRTTVAPFRLPDSYPSFTRIEGLELAVDPVDTDEQSARIFGTDLRSAGVPPLHLIIKNGGSHEFEINAAQIFGINAAGEFAEAYTLQQASHRVRESSVGTKAATGLAVGALTGAAAGAAIGAGAAGGRGAATGAAVGGAVGGVAEGTSDVITQRFKRELTAQDFGDRVMPRVTSSTALSTSSGNLTPPFRSRYSTLRRTRCMKSSYQFPFGDLKSILVGGCLVADL